jgi:hypothetical protein
MWKGTIKLENLNNIYQIELNESQQLNNVMAEIPVQGTMFGMTSQDESSLNQFVPS